MAKRGAARDASGAKRGRSDGRKSELERLYECPFPDEFFEVLAFAAEQVRCRARGMAAPSRPRRSRRRWRWRIWSPLGRAWWPRGRPRRRSRTRFTDTVRAPPAPLLGQRLIQAAAFDPPEVLTVFRSVARDGLHWGYFRDAPDEMPSGVVRNDCGADRGIVERGTFECAGPGLAAALAKHAAAAAPGGAAAAAFAGIAKRAKRVPTPFARRVRVDNTLSGLGIVVPFDASSQVGWRPLEMEDAELRLYLRGLLEAKERGESPWCARQPRGLPIRPRPLTTAQLRSAGPPHHLC